jgi:ABC-type glycerol-3-phosphate transport system permease component
MKRLAAHAAAGLTGLLFLYPYLWMLASSFRTTRQVLSAPLRLWPEQFDPAGFRSIAEISDLPLARALANSLLITGASTLLAVAVTAFGAYAITRRPRAWAFVALRYGFLVTIMYPAMLLVIPTYIVVYKLGLLGSYAGIILVLAMGPVQFFLFEQFFRALPMEIIEAATIDGAGEAQILLRVVLPMAQPVVATVAIITFLLNWSHWFPVLVISTDSDTWTLPVALLNLNGELGANFQGIMALAVVTTLPVAALFLLAQRRVIAGMTEGAVKG